MVSKGVDKDGVVDLLGTSVPTLNNWLRRFEKDSIGSLSRMEMQAAGHPTKKVQELLQDTVQERQSDGKWAHKLREEEERQEVQREPDVEAHAHT